MQSAIFSTTPIKIFFLLLTFSCSQKKGNENAIYKALNESLINAYEQMATQNEGIYMTFEERLEDPVSLYKAKIWQPKAILVKKYADSMIAYIDSLKFALTNEAGFIEGDKTDSWQNNRGAAGRLFVKKQRGKELYARLEKCRQDMLNVDSFVRKEFNHIALLPSFDTLEKTEERFTGKYFNNVSAIAALAMLNKFKNEIRIAEHRIIVYCLENTTYHSNYRAFSVIIGQNSSYVKGGEVIEIMAGVGAFTTEILPEIFIGGKNIPLNNDAIAIYKIKSPLKPGKYKVPAIINYIDAEGRKQTVSKTIEYTVQKD